jgi:tetratricopeptide (TPR) repeat protein
VLDAALDAGVLVVTGTRYRFRHELVRQALTEGCRRTGGGLCTATPAAPRRGGRRAARSSPTTSCCGPRRPGRSPSCSRRRGAPSGSAPSPTRSRTVERLLGQEPGHHDGLRLRAEILDALGDGRAPAAYAAAAEAIGEPEAQELTAQRALAQLKASDPVRALQTLEGCEPRTTRGAWRGPHLQRRGRDRRLRRRGHGRREAEEAHRLALELGDPGAILDATWAHALAAHAKGELPARLRTYLRTTSALPEIATRVFDGQLCVTERMLHGGLPGAEIIAFADGLAAEAERLGAARGHAFAVTLRGEAGVLAGHLDRADADFADGARLHGRIGATAGEALSLLGRAQVATARGRPEHARPFLAEALLLARESEVGHHTLDRIYGAMVEAAPEPSAGAALVAEAETAIRGPAETCPTCRIAFVVPAAIAAARAGDLERARRYARDCENALEIIALPPAWHAAGTEVRGWVARAEGFEEAAREHFRGAATTFATWGQPLDAERCTGLAGDT